MNSNKNNINIILSVGNCETWRFLDLGGCPWCKENLWTELESAVCICLLKSDHIVSQNTPDAKKMCL